MAILRLRPHLIKMITMLVVPALLLGVSPAKAQDIQFSLQEYKIKAGLIYNFLKYTQWPQKNGHDKKIKVCLLGGDPFDGYLFPLEGRTAQQATIEIKEIQFKEEADNCNLVLINKNQKSYLTEQLAYFKGKQILTISDLAYFTDKGGMVEFSMKTDKRVHMYVNKQTLEASTLSIDPRLLNLAEVVAKK